MFIGQTAILWPYVRDSVGHLVPDLIGHPDTILDCKNMAVAIWNASGVVM